MSHLTKCHVSLAILDASKNLKYRPSRNLTKFDLVTRFGEKILTVKSIFSSEIYKISRFSIEITVLPFLRKIEFFPGFKLCMTLGGTCS